MRNSKKRKIRIKRYQRRKHKRILRRKSIARQFKLGINKSRNVKSGNITLTTKLLGFLSKKKFIKSGRVNEQVKITIPKIFSFIEAPETTIDILQRLFFYGTHKQVKKIYFDHSECKTLGICASTVMDVILMEIKKSNKLIKRATNLGGVLPDKGDVLDILEFSGILRHLGYVTKEKDHIIKLDLLKGSSKEPPKSGLFATKITDYFLQCLATQNLTLNKDGRNKLSELVGEIVDNCELHGGDYSEWYTLGHYHRVADKNYGECHLVLFCFGNTIYNSLSSQSTSKETLESLRKITKRHTGFFNFRWTEESLWTLYALQDGVSRLRDKVKDPDRGTGTVKLIHSFQSIGKTKDGHRPIMSITSGHIHIVFNQEYKLQNKEIDGEVRQIIAFNKENDLNQPPDKNNVQILNNYFPGTVISMKFYLDQAYLTEKMEANNNGNKTI